MSKLSCECGHIIVDQTDNLPYKAHFIRDQNIKRTFTIYDKVEDFLSALKTNKRNEWIDAHFGKDYPKNLTDSSIICDLIVGSRLESTIYQCEKCLGLLVLKGNKNAYRYFSMKDEDSQEIFEG
jgi:hypothetical protein